MTSDQFYFFKRALWPPDAARRITWFAVLDGARSPTVRRTIAGTVWKSEPLFAGQLSPELLECAPYLVQLDPGDRATADLFRAGWNDHWGILIRSEDPFAEVRRHLRTLLRVRDEAGRYMLFRFYDPRVLRPYLPTCTGPELRQIFGTSIRRIVLPSDRDGATVYELAEQSSVVQLRTDAINYERNQAPVRLD